MALILMNDNADVKIKDHLKRTPLYWTVSNNHRDNLEPSSLQKDQLRLQILDVLISKGVDLNEEYKEGHRPLHLAVLAVRKDVITVLVKNGADLEIRSHLGDTPLMRFVQNDFDKTRLRRQNWSQT